MEESIVVRIGDIVFAVLFVFDYIVFNVTFAHGGARWWLWALGMAQIGDLMVMEKQA